MSETATTTLFQPGAVINDAPPEEPEGSNGNRRTLLALAGLGLLAVLGVAVYFLFFTGGSDPAPAVPVGSNEGTSAAPAAPVAPVPDKPAALPKISAKNFGTDPFHALITEPAAGGAAAAGGTTTASGTTVSSGTTTDTGTTSDTTAGTTTPTTTAPAPSTAYRFQVVKVASDNSSVDAKVNGKTYKNLKAGEVFGKIFKVRFISGAVNSFQIGDEVFNVSGAKAVTISN